MKSISILMVLLLSNTGFAAISESAYDLRHQSLIEQAVLTCGYNGVVTQLSSEEVVVNIDQGIRDVYYTTVLSVKVGIDQYMYDEYRVSVKSEFADMYDHSAADWGVYSITSTNCHK